MTSTSVIRRDARMLAVTCPLDENMRWIMFIAASNVV